MFRVNLMPFWDHLMFMRISLGGFCFFRRCSAHVSAHSCNTAICLFHLIHHLHPLVSATTKAQLITTKINLFISNLLDIFRFLLSFHHINDTKNNENRDNDYKWPSKTVSHSPTPAITHHATTLTSTHLGKCWDTKTKQKRKNNHYIFHLLPPVKV